jgi:histidinol-phosphatase
MKNNFLQIAKDAAKKAEEVVLKYYTDDIRVMLKPDQSPVTIADQEAEQIIVDTIKAAFPDHGFLGEEGAHDIQEYTWVIDPIDGTKNYLKQIPIFGTQIALLHNGALILGVSNAPALKELAYAEKNTGAFINDKKVSVSKIADIANALVMFGNLKYFIEKDYMKNLEKIITDSYYDRGMGDFYMYHYLACGKTDVVIEAGVKIWDVAAIKVIVEEAGGKVTDIFGQPLTKDSTTIIATNGLLHDKVVEYFS